MSNLVAKQQKEKALLIEILRKTPIIEAACKKANLPRATFYRWRKEDADFAAQIEEALDGGRGLINDLAESKLINAINENKLGAITYWLKNNHPRYTEKLALVDPQKDKELSDEEKEQVMRSLTLGGIVKNENEGHDG